jgi:hypothetical protein
LTTTISILLLLLKLPVFTSSLNNIRYYSKAGRDNILRGFTKKSTLATGIERTEDSSIYTREVLLL